MTLPIIEEPLYGQIQLETAAWGSTFTWVDRTATLVNGIAYAEGGRVNTPGISSVDVGTLNATLKDAATVPVIGDLVRLRRYGTSEYFFTGYVQDVSQRIVFDTTTILTSPIVLTTLHCADWVGYIGQFQAVGAGAVETTGVVKPQSYYAWPYRIEALNKSIDATMATDLITYTGTGSGLVNMGDTDLVGSLAEHLDLITRTVLPTYWYGTHTLPTDNTTGRDGLIAMTDGAPTASGYTFRDDATSGGSNLHYTEIDFENSTQNIANTLVIDNRVRLQFNDVEVTKVGGFNESNIVVIGNQNVVGIMSDISQKKTDATSITNYGIRQTQFDSNVGVSNSLVFNLCANPSMDYSDDGYVSGTSNSVVRRRKPADEPTPFTAYNGEWVTKVKVKTAAGKVTGIFQGGESDGTPVVPATTYYLKAFALRGTTSQTNSVANVEIRWIDENETEISRTTGTQIALTNANQWYEITVSGIAPSTAVRANLHVDFRRSSGSNLAVGDRLYFDAMSFSKTDTTYYNGDFAPTDVYVYGWTGGVGNSMSFRATNTIDDLADQFLAKYSTTSMRVARIRWNAQENLSAVSSLTVGKSIAIVYKGTTTTYKILGIDGTIDPSRYMIDYYLEKV